MPDQRANQPRQARRLPEPATGVALIALVAIVVLAAAVRFIGLGTESLWLDEIDSVLAAKRPAWELLTEPTGNKQPLYFLLLKGWTAIFGYSEFSVRAPSAIFGVLTVIATYWMARRLGGEWTGLGSALVVALASGMTWYSQDARMYTLTALLLVASTGFMLRYFEHGRRSDAALYAVFALLGLYSHYYFLPFVAVQIAAGYALFAKRRQGERIWVWTGAAAFASLALLTRANVVWHDVTSVGMTSFTESPGALLPRVFHTLGPLNRQSASTAIDLNLLFVALIWAAVLAGTVLAVRRRSYVAFLPLVAFGGGALMLLAHVAASDLPITVRYFVPAIPLWAVTGVWGVVELARMAWERGNAPSARAVTFAAGAGAVVVFALGMAAWAHELNTLTRHQWRESAALVASGYSPGDAVHIEPPWYVEYFEHYFGDDMRTLNAGGNPDSWCSDGHRVWLVNTRGTAPDDVEKTLAEKCAVMESERFVGSLSVALFVSRSADGAVSVLCDGLVPTVIGTSASEKLNGTPGDDVIVGLGGDDTLNGLGGDDVMCGGDGNDVLNGGEGNNRLFGEDGDDTLNAGSGNDHLDGGAGTDALNPGGGENTCEGGEKGSRC